MICLLGVTAWVLTAAETPKTFTGVITDTMCGVKLHSAMMKDKTEAECVKLCVNVMKLSDQSAPAKYAAHKVTVTGTYDEKSKTLKVVSIEPAE
jgi:hypothetical protein